MDRARLAETLSAFGGVYVGDAIPPKKRANAALYCRVSADEIVGLIDCTTFGSAKYAVVFATRGVFARDRWTLGFTDGIVAISYDELTISATDTVVTIGKTIAVPRRTLTGPTHDVLVAVAAAAKQDRLLASMLKTAPQRPGGPAQPWQAPPDVDPLDPTTTALQAAIHESPDDEGARLVLADHLLSADDPRGELIVLDARERETTEGITDVEALERYLLLAAEYSFPNARPEEPALPFVRVDPMPLEYSALYEGRRYVVRYRARELGVTVDGARRILSARIDCADNNAWTEDERMVILQLVSDALRYSTPLGSLRFPFSREPVPRYGGGPLRGYRLPREFTEPRGIAKTRYGLAARDFRRWLAVWSRLARLTR